MRYITLAIAFLIGTSAEAQVIRAEPFYTAPQEAVSGNLLLDNYPGAAVAYSLRKLDKDYTGSAIRVRRSSDNTEQNIGFVNNYLDTASMKTFVGNNNGFVVTWYNQTDSSGIFGVRNVTQGTAANQPQIIASGAIQYSGGEVAINFDGSNDFFASGSIPAFNVDLHTGFYVSEVDDTTAARAVYSHNFTSGSTGDADRLLISFSSAGSFIILVRDTAGAAIQSITGANLDQTLISNSWKSDNTVTGYLNGTIFNTTGSGADSSPSGHRFFRIGAQSRTTAAVFFDGRISEIIMYASDNSSNRTAIESNINSFYSIY